MNTKGTLKVNIYCPKCKTITQFQEEISEDGYFDFEECLNCHWKNHGGDTHISLYSNTVYSEDCNKCDKKHILLTQSNRFPEYYTTVKIICDCGNLIKFDLPVN